MIERIKAQLRHIYVPLIEKHRHKKREQAFLQSIGKLSRRTGFIIGSPNYTNLGDSAIFLAQKHFIENCGCEAKEITSKEYYDFRKRIQWMIKTTNPIFGMGGGNMGNQWPAEEIIRKDLIHDFPQNKIVVFPQTVHFIGNVDSVTRESELLYNSHLDLTIVAREKKSFDLMKEHYTNATILLTPDIVLSSSMEEFGVVPAERSGVLFVTRSDPEKAVPDTTWEILERVAIENGRVISKTDMYSSISVTKENRAELVRKKMQEFCGAELVITDRLHGMVFAALTGTPCIVFSNYNHKVKGTYDWISYLPYIRHVETSEEAEKAIPELLALKECRFDNTPLLPYFDKLAEVLKVNAAN